MHVDGFAIGGTKISGDKLSLIYMAFLECNLKLNIQPTEKNRGT